MSHKKKLEEVSRETGVAPQTIVEFIHQEWILPSPTEDEFDEEDIARARLILELREDFGVNDEGIEIILHLLDEIYSLQGHIKSL